MPNLNMTRTYPVATRVFVLCVYAAILSMFAGCTPTPKKIYGDIANMPDIKVFLSRHDGGMQRLDSCVSSEGRFLLKAPGGRAGILYVEFDGYEGSYVPIFTDGESILLSGNFNYQGHLTVSGSPANDDLTGFWHSVRSHGVMVRAIERSLAGYADSLAIADSLLYENLHVKRDSLTGIISEARTRFIKENPSSILSAVFILNLCEKSRDRSEIDSLISVLDTDDMPDNEFLRKLRKTGKEGGTPNK